MAVFCFFSIKFSHRTKVVAFVHRIFATNLSIDGKSGSSAAIVIGSVLLILLFQSVLENQFINVVFEWMRENQSLD